MMQEFEKKESTEILPQNLGELAGNEAGSILKRASERIEIIYGTETASWNGIKENLDGLRAWSDTNRAKLTKATLKAISGATFVAAVLSACSPTIARGENTSVHGAMSPQKSTLVDISTTTEATPNFPQISGGLQEAPQTIAWTDKDGKRVEGYIDNNGKKRKLQTFYDVVNQDAKLGEKGYDYGVIALSDKYGFGIIHRVAGYYYARTYLPDEHVYGIFYYPIQVPPPPSGH